LTSQIKFILSKANFWKIIPNDNLTCLKVLQFCGVWYQKIICPMIAMGFKYNM
jgi:hypothetical protein